MRHQSTTYWWEKEDDYMHPSINDKNACKTPLTPIFAENISRNDEELIGTKVIAKVSKRKRSSGYFAPELGLKGGPFSMHKSCETQKPPTGGEKAHTHEGKIDHLSRQFATRQAFEAHTLGS